jgi:hypothetical protein
MSNNILPDLTPYQTQWVALADEDNNVGGSGRDIVEAKADAEKNGYADPRKITFFKVLPFGNYFPTFQAVEYKKAPIPENPNAPWFPLPLIKIRLSYKEKIIQFDALNNSGADVSLFHASAAKALGIDLKSGIKQEYLGVSGHKIEAYFHTVKLQIVGEAEATELAVGFTESEGVSALLGQADFFQAYKISFERYKERIEINPAPKK